DAYRLATGQRTKVASQLSCPLCRSPVAPLAPVGRCFAQPHGDAGEGAARAPHSVGFAGSDTDDRSRARSYDCDPPDTRQLAGPARGASSRGLAAENLAVFLDRSQKAPPNGRSTIFLLDRDFNPIMNARVTEGTPLPAITDLATPKAVIMSLTPQVSAVVRDVLTKRPVVHVEVPVIMESEVRYILGMAVETSFFSNVLHATAPDAIWVVD